MADHYWICRCSTCGCVVFDTVLWKFKTRKLRWQKKRHMWHVLRNANFIVCSSDDTNTLTVSSRGYPITLWVSLNHQYPHRTRYRVEYVDRLPTRALQFREHGAFMEHRLRSRDALGSAASRYSRRFLDMVFVLKRSYWLESFSLQLKIVYALSVYSKTIIIMNRTLLDVMKHLQLMAKYGMRS